MTTPLTPTKFSQVRNITGEKNGKSYAFNSIGFITREDGDKKWYNLAFNGECPLKEGVTYDLNVKERPYKDKDGNDKTAYDCKFPDKFDEMAKLLMNHEQRLGRLEAALKEIQNPRKAADNIPIINSEDGPLPPPPGDEDYLG